MTAELNNAVGIFDSGLGGLTALMALERICPQADIVYFGDTARVPYGSRSNDQLRVFARQNVELLKAHGACGVIAACGTISSLITRQESEEYPLPFYGITEAAAKRAAALTKSGRIGIIATEATVRNRGFEKQLAQRIPGLQLTYSACPDFVPLAERGIFDPGHPELKKAVDTYLEPIMEQGADVIILGCTHYPLLQDAIKRVTGSIPLVNSGGEAAKDYCAAASPLGSGKRLFLVSGDPSDFKQTAQRLLGREIPLPTAVDPAAY